MAKVPVDQRAVDSCRAIAANIADDVQRFIDAHTTVGVERTTARAYGVEGLDDQGTPLVNVLVDRCHAQGYTAHGIALFLGNALVSGAPTINAAAERLAYGRDWGGVPTDVAAAR
ncbi:MAG: lysine 5,6-aminomutase subunit alpha, partial [Polyangiaceae bacterium]